MIDQVHVRAVAKRMLAHHEAGTTDQAAEQRRVSVASYHDPARWQLEVDRIFKRVPMPLALSCELRGPNDYKAMEAVGVPVLLVRNTDGVARAFLNVCRHRGAIVCETGCGTARRFSCPYHGWVYDQAGALVGVYGEESFGDLDRDQLGLVPLTCDERGGFVFVTLTPGVGTDIDEWLGEYGDELASLGLQDWHVFSVREQPSPAWKVAFDGYLEGYHFASLHKTTLFKDTLSNLMAVDAHGPHQRVVFARRTLPALRDLPEDEWDATDHVGPVYTLFPCLSLAGGWRDQAMVSQLFPGPTPDRSRTIQTIITRYPVESDEDRAKTTAYTDFLYDVVRDEDYATGFGITSALGSGANDEFVFGRNELSLHHFHAWVDSLVAVEP